MPSSLFETLKKPRAKLSEKELELVDCHSGALTQRRILLNLHQPKVWRKSVEARTKYWAARIREEQRKAKPDQKSIQICRGFIPGTTEFDREAEQDMQRSRIGVLPDGILKKRMSTLPKWHNGRRFHRMYRLEDDLYYDKLMLLARAAVKLQTEKLPGLYEMDHLDELTGFMQKHHPEAQPVMLGRITRHTLEDLKVATDPEVEKTVQYMHRRELAALMEGLFDRKVEPDSLIPLVTLDSSDPNWKKKAAEAGRVARAFDEIAKRGPEKDRKKVN